MTGSALIASQKFPGTLEATLAGCNCGMSPTPRRSSLPQNAAKLAVGRMIFEDDPATVNGSLQDRYRTVEAWSYTDAIHGTLSPVAPENNDDPGVYFGDCALESLTHNVSTKTITFKIAPREYSVTNAQSSSIWSSREGYASNLTSNMLPENGDVIHIRNVNPTEYCGRYVVLKTGHRTFEAKHTSPTQLSAASANGANILLGVVNNPTSTFWDSYAVKGDVMVASLLDDSYRRVLIKSQHSDRLYPININYIARYLDYNLQTASENIGTINSGTLIRNGAAAFNIATTLETFVAPSCPLHSPSILP